MTTVKDAYDLFADRVIENGYRYDHLYLATKALTDWRLLSRVDLHSARVLNIGCAEPIDEITYVARCSEWYALDINKKMIDTASLIARRHLSDDLYQKLRFVTGDATNLDYPDGFFDVVCAFSTIEHIKDSDARKRSVRELSRVCRPGGHVLITVPNWNNINYRSWSVKAQKSNSTNFGYEYLYKPQELKKELVSAGLSVEWFISNYRVIEGFLPYSIDLQFFEKIMVHFGDRMGFLCRK